MISAFEGRPCREEIEVHRTADSLRAGRYCGAVIRASSLFPCINDGAIDGTVKFQFLHFVFNTISYLIFDGDHPLRHYKDLKLCAGHESSPMKW